jgi:hypothetical protein
LHPLAFYVTRIGPALRGLNRPIFIFVSSKLGTINLAELFILTLLSNGPDSYLQFSSQGQNSKASSNSKAIAFEAKARLSRPICNAKTKATKFDLERPRSRFHDGYMTIFVGNDR